jgi:LacI family transcriptional regulator
VPTLQDIANYAKVSTATVSKVVNRRPDVGAKSVAMVENAMATLNYQPRGAGRPHGNGLNGSKNGSKTRRTNRIALLIPGISRAQINSLVYMDVLHGVERVVREAGKSFVLTHLEPGVACSKEIFSQQVDGVIVFGEVSDQRLAVKLRSMPCVQVMGQIKDEGWWDHVSYDNAKLGKIAAHYLLERGHRHVAFICNTHRDFFIERGKCLQAVMEAAGGTCLLQIDDNLHNESGKVIRIAHQRLQALLDPVFTETTANRSPVDQDDRKRTEGKPRTALFLAADTLAPPVCAELKRRGLVLGSDIDVISCNNEEMLLAHLDPCPATIDIHAEQIGQKAVEQLLWRIDQRRAPRITLALEPTLVAGEIGETSYGDVHDHRRHQTGEDTNGQTKHELVN